jgi:UDP-2-acetamido-2,6-beta-L-arabino-hexul-4-ose reductase
VLVYRFPNLFGKWCRPNYNSAVATFCHNIARGLPITVSDPAVRLTLLYIDDLVDEMFCALRGEAHRCEFDGLAPLPTEGGRYALAPITHEVTLGEIVSHLESFRDRETSLLMPRIPRGSFAAKLYATYLSYLPPEAAAVKLASHTDARGSFTELMKTADCGQFSVNVSLPGITKGQHWHHTKWEYFVVVAGHGVIRQRRLGSEEVIEYPVSGDELTAVRMLPGYTHSIENTSDTENLVTVMWANECFDPARPDTFYEEV